MYSRAVHLSCALSVLSEENLGGDINRKRILVVACDEGVRNFCCEALTHDGHSVELAAGMHEALGRLRSSSYDLVISDIEVPRLDGIDLYISILKNHPYLKKRFLFITGDGSADLKSFLSYVQTGYITQPVKRSELMEAVEKAFTGDGTAGGSNFLEKRREGRFRMEAECVVGQNPALRGSRVRSLDISTFGLKVRCGEDALIPRTEVSVTVDAGLFRFERKARVAWKRPVGGSAHEAGLRFTEPFADASIISFAGGCGAGSN